jgi:exodeoxyribonuclease V gamma subunit
VRRHPLQPFDPRNFDPSRPFSFDRFALAGARASLRPRSDPPPLVEAPLPAVEEEAVALDDLVRFVQHPARAFLRQRLGISTFDDDVPPDDALPLALEGLDRWRVGDRVLGLCLSGVPRDVAARAERLRGDLPPGPLGTAVLREVGAGVDALLNATEAERAIPAGSLDVDVVLGDGRRVVGTVAGLRGATLLDVAYSRLAPKHRLAGWVRLLAAVAASGDAELRAVVVGTARDGAERCVLTGTAPAIAVELLAELADLRAAGLRAPLPMAVKTSAAYAQARLRMSEANARAKAAKEWETDRFAPENAEPEHELLFGAGTRFAAWAAGAPAPGEEFADESTRFGALARRLWNPLLAQQGTHHGSGRS